MIGELNWRSRVVAVLGVVALAGCGGGGDDDAGGGGPFPPGDSVLSAFFVPSFAPFEAAAANLRNNVARYTRQRNSWWHPTEPGRLLSSYPLASSRAEYAHAAGLTGRGSVVAVVDDGFRTTHEAFTGKTIQYFDSPPPVDNHGTAVASVIAGNSSSMIGIAPGANLAIGSFASPTTLASATNLAIATNAVAQNNSWGYEGLAANTSSFNLVFSGADGQAYLSALDRYAARGVVVFAVSNNAAQTTSWLMEALPAVRSSLEPGWLAVMNAVPTFDNAGITSLERISAPCLQAARWCLAADGAWIAASSASNTSYEFTGGSSFAAPQVSGALALLAEAFPTLTPHELRIRLLASAQNSFSNFVRAGSVELVPGFFHDYSTEFGHGFLDIRAALLPIGPTTLQMEDGTLQDVAAPLLVSGAASGDAVARSLARHEVLVSDIIGGDFMMGGDALVAESGPPPLADDLLVSVLSTDLTAARERGAGSGGTIFARAAGRTLDIESGDGALRTALLLPSGGGQDLGVSVQRSFDTGSGGFDIGLTLGRDGGALLGAAGDGGAGTGLVALDIGLRQDLAGGAFLHLKGQVGVAEMGAGGLLRESTSMSFNSIGLDFGQRDLFAAGDRLTLGVELPTAITSGSARAVLPVARTLSGMVYDTVDVGFAPSDRQVDLKLTYQTGIGRNAELMMGAVHAMNHGHVEGRRETAGVLGLTWRF